jgi:hypothetical protein
VPAKTLKNQVQLSAAVFPAQLGGNAYFQPLGVLNNERQTAFSLT